MEGRLARRSFSLTLTQIVYFTIDAVWQKGFIHVGTHWIGISHSLSLPRFCLQVYLLAR